MTEPPVPGKAADLLPGLRWVCVPLPFPPGHVNCWLLEDGDGWLLIDTGAEVPQARELWEQVFATALNGRPITRVLVTHFHPDHVGLAGWMCARWNAPLLMSRTDYLISRMLLLEDIGRVKQQQIALGQAAGAPEAYLAHLRARAPFFRTEVGAMPQHFVRVAAGDRLAIGGGTWQVLVGEGHAPEMLCLYSAERAVLIAADQVLLRISPFIGLLAWETDSDPLADFLRSNAPIARLPAETLVLPSHGEPFTGLRERIAALSVHHDARLLALEDACIEPKTVYEASRVLFPRELNGEQTSFALGESLAHVNRLLNAGRLERVGMRDGATLYRSTGGGKRRVGGGEQAAPEDVV